MLFKYHQAKYDADRGRIFAVKLGENQPGCRTASAARSSERRKFLAQKLLISTEDLADA